MSAAFPTAIIIGILVGEANGIGIIKKSQSEKQPALHIKYILEVQWSLLLQIDK